jgi:UMF1 family MFS transporter
MGGTQSLSRSTYSKLLPDTTDHASFFSFYDITEKLGIVLGLLLFGVIDSVTGSMRNATIALSVLYLIGLLWLYILPSVPGVTSAKLKE